jgi:hypothetical protein
MSDLILCRARHLGHPVWQLQPCKASMRPRSDSQVRPAQYCSLKQALISCSGRKIQANHSEYDRLSFSLVQVMSASRERDEIFTCESVSSASHMAPAAGTTIKEISVIAGMDVLLFSSCYSETLEAPPIRSQMRQSVMIYTGLVINSEEPPAFLFFTIPPQVALLVGVCFFAAPSVYALGADDEGARHGWESLMTQLVRGSIARTRTKLLRPVNA